MPWTGDETLLGFARALRAAGMPVTADRERTFLTACAAIGVPDRVGVYWSGRGTLCASPADIEPYDKVFTGWFGGAPLDAVTGQEVPRMSTVQADLTDSGSGGSEEGDDTVRAVASPTEVLRHRDVAGLSPQDRAELRRLFGALRPQPPTRAARRHTAAHRGQVDGPATLRAQLKRMGEPARVRYRRRATRPRQVVLLIDVSGSMSSYADSLLRLAHTFVRAAPRTTEVFTMGTRLTRVTHGLRERDPDRALLRAGEAVPDWSGGTRLGEMLGAFLDRWGRRGMARRAVVVILSDGWERDGTELLAEQMRRLHSLAHAVVWVNPHRGKPGYAPVQQGIVAALPYCDQFVAGHSMAAFEEMVEVVRGA